MKVSSLKKNPNNPRQIKGEKLELLKKSVTEFSKMMSLRPIIIDETNTVLGGNMRLAAIKALGMKEIPDDWVKCADDLTEDEKREFTIKDNAGFGEWDYDLLANKWSDLPLNDWGLDLPGFETVGEEPKDAPALVDKAAELNKKWEVKSGDLWAIGEHRLLCGDSTKAEDVTRVLNGAKPNLMVTDPPYGVEYEPAWRDEAAEKGLIGYAARSVAPVLNDDRIDWSGSYQLFEGNVFYCWHADRHASAVQASVEISGFEVRSQIIWAKPNFAISRGHYNWQHEPCWYAVRKGENASWVGSHSESTLWEINRNSAAEGGHSTQKPLECMARPIRNHEGDVYDPFCGSGTTIVACQNLNRKCYAIEISEKYCAVILERMRTAFPELEIKRIEEVKEANV
jgi:DNA modification methylase